MPLCLCSLASRKTWSVIASDVTKRSLSVAEDQPQAASTINTLFIRLALSEDDLVLGSEDTDLSQTGTRKITLGKGKILAQSGAEELTVQTSQGDVKLPPNSVVAIQSDGKNNVRVSSLGGDGTIGAIINNKSSTQSVQLSSGEELLLTADMADEEFLPADGMLEREVVSGRIQFDDNIGAVKTRVNVNKLVNLYQQRSQTGDNVRQETRRHCKNYVAIQIGLKHGPYSAEN